jgi:hypothetical protein
MRSASFSILAIAALASVVSGTPAKRDWTTLSTILDGPIGAANQTFQMTVDNGKTWTGNARNMPLGGKATVGFRASNSPETAFIAKVCMILEWV